MAASAAPPSSTTGARAYGTTPRINGTRLVESIHYTSETWGAAHRYGEDHTETGMARLSLDDDDAAVRRWLAKEAEALGCTVTVDQIGNMFLVRGGENTDVPPTFMGSHLDTQATGGRYDGILGVLAGLEALRTIHEQGVKTKGPIGLVNWTNEEGARFPMITMASGVWAGVTSLEAAWNCKETPAAAARYGHSDPVTVKEELQRIGFLGTTPATPAAMPMAAHFELHIEQGPILEAEDRPVGVVEGAQGYAWYEVTVRGKDAHAGTTPLHRRRDALLAAAQMIVASNGVAHAESASTDKKVGVVTAGVVSALPGTPNTIPHTASFTLDIRHPEPARLQAMVAACKTQFADIGAKGGVSVDWACLSDNAPAVFHPDCVAAVEAAAEEEVGQHTTASGATITGHRRMWSGAGHDSCNVNKHYPAGMVFTRTKDGLSHTPVEYCSPEDCIKGAQVLLGAVLRFDAKRDI
ncbi:hypothetical protein HMPREF1624_06355 [Sporothrix schenckii ATCC 58251]|uniref:Peptidase M20 dimerisation domain-containing protein n=1 Tax=Sporothrix schenckii (strain ATCC 58251 / de Perez 2211183) TaxID=1391915 RepID=U7PN71_SPOS1|nr:hypothetical protein HMPREF1624_06355 [Sporothrix schenckii ATCC 58251]